MREILFRGKTDKGEWIEGVYYKQTLFYGDDFEAYYIISSKDELKDNMMTFERVIPETVGQYTGLTDKNGKKIFEGDILSYEYGDLKKRGVVFYYDRGAKFGIKENDGHNNLSLLHDTQVKAWNIKIIGNIHDNPELLKGGAE